MSAAVTDASRLYLVDAHAYLHRAYHALPPLTTSKGEPVGALYGFARLLLLLLRRDKPRYMAVCFDSPGPTFRHKAFALYKATRKEIDEDLKTQLALARELVSAMGLSCVEAAGFEADDLMATLARRAERAGLSVVLVTGDKDALQMVDERIQVLNEAKGEVFDGRKVVEKFKVGPERIADYLALTGDSADNVPGVPGVGPVGAVKLLHRFGSLDGILEAASRNDPGIPVRALSAIRESEPRLRMSRKLVELDAAAPVEVELEECRTASLDLERALPLFRRLEFNSLIREAAGRAAEAAEAPAGEPEELPAPMSLKAWLKTAAHAGHVTISLRQIEAPAADGSQELPLGQSRWTLALGLRGRRSALAASNEIGPHRAALARLLADPEVVKIGHDFKAMSRTLEEASLPLKAPRFDAMLAAYCLNPSLARYDFPDVYSSHVRASAVPEEAPGHSVLRESILLWDLAEVLKRSLKAKGLDRLYEDLELPLIDVLAGMEREGIGLDRDYLRVLREDFEDRILAVHKELESLAGAEINLNSTKQLRRLLFEELRLPVVHKTPKGEPSTDEETLSVLSLRHPLPAKIVAYRELAKLKSTYIDGLLARMDPAGRVHTHFDQTGTATGRLSSLEPNLQNIPIRTALGQKIRRAFVAGEGRLLLSADYSQIDLRVLAHLSEDAALCEAFRRGEDVHLRTACEIFGVPPEKADAELRRRAKAVNFGIVYGQTAHGLSQELGIPFGAAREHIQRYFARYHGVARWLEKNLEAARREGCVRTILGRVRLLPDLAAKNTAVRQFNERAAANTPIQGSSADIIKQAMVNIHRRMSERSRHWRSKLVLQVHDELLFECPRAEAEEFGQWARREMECAVELRVPLAVDLKLGENWRDMKPLERRS